MIEKGANFWGRGLYGACRGGHKNLALLMLKKGAKEYIFYIEGMTLKEHPFFIPYFSELRTDIRK